MGLILFDPIGILGCLVSRDANQSSEGGRLIARYAQADQLLDSLRQNHTLGILAQKSRLSGVDEAVAAIDLGFSFDPIFVDRDSVDESVLAGLVDAHTQVAFVSASSALRAAIAPHVSATAPHAALAEAALQSGDLVFFRAVPRVGWTDYAKDRPIVPALLEHGAVFGIGSRTALLDAETFFENMEMLGDQGDVASGDLVIIRFLGDSEAETEEQLSRLKELPIFWIEDDQACAVAAFRFDHDMAAWMPRVAPHGQRVAVAPRRILLDQTSTPFPQIERPITYSSDFIAELNNVTEQWIDHFLGALCYGRCLPDGVGVPRHPLISRKVSHPDNERAVELLRFQLSEISAPHDAWLHWFRTSNDFLPNVIGSLPGSVEDKRVVVLGAHLDSKNAHSDKTQIALGADDDASGVAAVLAAAELHARYSAANGRAKATILYSLFNSEERFLIGSQAFADDLKTAGYEVIAMLQADMVGWSKRDGDAEGFTIWCGNDAASSSSALGKLIADTAMARIHDRQLAWGDGYNLQAKIGQAVPDGKEDDSDQLSFRHLWPAALVTESKNSSGKRNPAYHSASDTTIDSVYAAAISRTLAAVSWTLANN